MTPPEFEHKMRNLLTDVYGPLKDTDGALESEIEAAKRKRSIADNPSILATCYQIAGRHQALTHGYVCLLTCNQLMLQPRRCDRDETEVPGMVFMVEQKNTEWFNLIFDDFVQSVDPPIYRGWADRNNFNDESDHLSCYLLEVVCSNSVGVLPSAHTNVSRLDLDKIATRLNRVTQDKDRFTFQKGPIVALAEGTNPDYKLRVASRSRDELVKFEKEMGFSFEYKYAEELNPPKYYPIG
jgi:hypothetical protein